MSCDDKSSTLFASPAPLVKIKQTLNRLKTESVQMDIRIGVIEHVLMQVRSVTQASGRSLCRVSTGSYAMFYL